MSASAAMIRSPPHEVPPPPSPALLLNPSNHHLCPISFSLMKSTLSLVSLRCHGRCSLAIRETFNQDTKMRAPRSIPNRFPASATYSSFPIQSWFTNFSNHSFSWCSLPLKGREGTRCQPKDRLGPLAPKHTSPYPLPHPSPG